MVLSTMFSWGILYGHLTVNTAKGVSDLERPENLEAQHRSWANAEFAAMVDGAREREARKRMMAHESDEASFVYEQRGNRSRQADNATRAINRKHKKPA